MNKNDFLETLIKGLTKSEKRYFKLFSSLSSKEDNKYIKLFDIILNKKDNDYSKIKEEFMDKTPKGSSFADKKKYLYNLILKSLRNFNSNNSIDFELRDALHNINILFNKGLYNQCLKLIKKTEEIATQNQRYTVLLELLKYRHGVIIETNDIKGLEELINTDYFVRKETINKLNNENEYIKLTLQIYTKLKKTDKIRTKKDEEELEQLINNPLLNDENKALTWGAKKYFYDTRIFYAYHCQNYEEAYLYSKKKLDFIEKETFLISNVPQSYIYTLSNLIQMSIDLGKYEELIELCEKTITVINNFRNTLDENFYKRRLFNVYGFQLRVFIIKNQYIEANTLADIILKEFESNENVFSVFNELYIELYFLIECLYIYEAKFKDALRINAKILNLKTEIRQDLQNVNQIMNLILNFELNEFDFLHYRIISVYRFLLKKQSLFKSEIEILKFIKTINKFKTRKDFIVAIKILKEKMIELKKDPFERKFFDYFDIIKWIDTKDKPNN